MNNIKGPRSNIRRKLDDQKERPAADKDEENLERRTLRASYRELQNTIRADRDTIGSADSRKFENLVSTLDTYHERVAKPREQIVDAQAVLDVTRFFVDSVRDARRKTGVTAGLFVTHIISRFSVRKNRGRDRDRDDNAPADIDWGRLGVAASGIFKVAPGLGTMLGPMDIEPKTRRAPAIRHPRIKPTQFTQAEEVKDRSKQEASAQTDANMDTMFRVLRRAKRAPLDALVLNRNSFSQTVENIFSLSFLVKDGRVAITIDGSGEHIVAPKNAPTSEARAAGEAKNTQFVFRFDSKCWQKMVESVPEGVELMPNRKVELETPGLVRKRERDTQHDDSQE